MSDLPTQEEALYALESPAFDATEQWCIDLLLPIFEAYAKGELVKLADADLEAIARAFLGPYYGDRGTVKDFYGQVRVALYAGFHKVVPGE